MAKGRTGLDVIMQTKGGNDDEFAKGDVGKPEQQEDIQKEGEMSLGETTLLYGGGLFETEKEGLEDGISAHEVVNLDDVEPEYNYAVDPMTGNAVERKVGRANNHTVKGKRGNSFSIGEM